MKQIFLVGLFILSFAQLSSAEEFIAKGRVFIGANSANPSELNTEMANQNIKEFKTITEYGVDITYAFNSLLDVGLRYERIDQKNLEENKTAGQDYYGQITQDAILGVARHTLLKSDVLRGDIFVAGGVASTKFSIVNATQDGQLASSGFTSLTAKAGGSIGVGFKKVFVFLEGGYDYNKISSGLSREKNINSNVGTLDLSGSYLAIGLLFDDITARK